MYQAIFFNNIIPVSTAQAMFISLIDTVFWAFVFAWVTDNLQIPCLREGYILFCEKTLIHQHARAFD